MIRWKKLSTFCHMHVRLTTAIKVIYLLTGRRWWREMDRFATAFSAQTHQWHQWRVIGTMSDYQHHIIHIIWLRNIRNRAWNHLFHIGWAISCSSIWLTLPDRWFVLSLNILLSFIDWYYTKCFNSNTFNGICAIKAVLCDWHWNHWLQLCSSSLSKYIKPSPPSAACLWKRCELCYAPSA